MNKYESVIIVNNSISEDVKKETIGKIENFIKENGKLEKVDVLGAKKLAYEIQKQKEGYYVVFYFDAKSQYILELERIYRITDEILKFMTIRVNEED